jgi:DNA-3-methyladenine glycosylase I
MPHCPWAGTDPLYVRYHDEEWGVPDQDGRALWEKLILDGFQAGLSWITILKKREAFRAAFAGFEPEVIATWGEPEVARLLADAGIVRHRGKIEATIGNARAVLDMGGTQAFSEFCWSHVDGRPVQNRWARMSEVPAATPVSAAFSKALKARGFRFCGPTIVYAWMQACGLVNDHLADCPRHGQVARLAW